MSIFYPSSINFIKKRAKELNHTFPAIQLSVCQEAVASALGFADYFDVAKQVSSKNIVVSLLDENLPKEEVISRRFQQCKSLAEITGLPSLLVNELQRSWHLTGSTKIDRGNFVDHYEEVDAELYDLENNNLSADEIYYRYENFGDDPPSRIAEGIILSCIGHKYMYYYLSIERLLKMPFYLRGVRYVFLDFEEGNFVKLAFPELFSKKENSEAVRWVRQNSPWIYELHTGKPSRDFAVYKIKDMLEEARKYPDDWYPLSIRWGNGEFNELSVSTISGSDFLKLIQSKGSINGLNIKWFGINKDYAREINQFLEYPEFSDLKHMRLDRGQLRDIQPPYASPFKFGPMSIDEYSPEIESPENLLSVDPYGYQNEVPYLPVVGSMMRGYK